MRLLLIGLAALFLGACVYTPPPDQCGLPNEPVVVSYTKSGFPIYDDQAALSVPCVEVTPPNTSTPPPPVKPPVEPPEPPVEPPVEPKPEKVKSNSGRGNGSELDGDGNDVDPGNSGGHNNGGD